METKILYSVIYLDEYKEFDNVPNNWLVDSTNTWYPDKSRGSLIKLAKAAATPKSSWLKLTMSIKKRDYDDYESSYSDAVRANLNQKSKASSEEDCKGTRKRRKNPKYFSDDSHDACNDEDDDEYYPSSDDNRPQSPSPKKEKKTKKHKYNPTGGPLTKLPSPSTFKFPKRSSTPCNLFRQRSENRPSSSTPPAVSPIKSSSPNRTQDRFSLTNRFSPIKRTQDLPITVAPAIIKKCKLAKKCIANDLHPHCSLLASVEATHSSIKRMYQDILSRLADNPQRIVSSANDAEEESHVLSTDEEGSVLSKFPFKSVSEFKEFNEEIKTDKLLYNQTIAALVERANKSNPVKCARSMAWRLLGPLKSQFSWKGQGVEQKTGFYGTKVFKAILAGVRRLWTTVPNLQVIVENTLQTWMSEPATQKKSN